MTKLVVVFALALPLCAVTPDCTASLQFTNDPAVQPNGTTILPLSGAPAPPINNNLGGSACQAWTLLYSFVGITASSLEVDTSATQSGPYVIWSGTVNYGSNPYQTNTNGYVNLTGTYNYLRMSANFISGVGTITIQAFGWINPANVGSILNYPINAGGGGISSVGANFPLSSTGGFAPNINLGYVPTPVADPGLIGQRSTEVGGRPTFVFLGDSYTQGTGCSTFAQCYVPIFNAAVINKFGARSANGMVMANAGTGASVPSQEGNITFSGSGWAPSTLIGPGGTRPDSAQMYSAMDGGAGSTATYTCTTAASFNIWFATYTDTAAGWTASIDSGSPVTYGATTTSAVTWAKQNISAGSAGTHTIHLAGPSSGLFHLFAPECLNGNVPGVIVENLGVAGSISSSIGTNPATQLGFYPLLPGASTKQIQTIIMIGTNDSFFGVPVSTYQSNLDNTIAYVSQFGPVLLVSQPLVSRSDLTAYNAAEFAAAQTISATNPPYLSIADAWGSIANETSLGLLNGDNVHPSNIGHGLITDQIYTRIISTFLGVSLGGIPLNAVANPTAPTDFQMGANTLFFDYGVDSSTVANMFKIEDSTNDARLGWMVAFASAPNSTLDPFRVLANGQNALQVMHTSEVGINLGTGGIPTAELDVKNNSSTESTIQGVQSGISRTLNVARNVASATFPVAQLSQQNASGGAAPVLEIQQANSSVPGICVNTDGNLVFNCNVLFNGDGTEIAAINSTSSAANLVQTGSGRVVNANRNHSGAIVPVVQIGQQNTTGGSIAGLLVEQADPTGKAIGVNPDGNLTGVYNFSVFGTGETTISTLSSSTTTALNIVQAGNARVGNINRNVVSATVPVVQIGQQNASGGAQAALEVQQANATAPALCVNTDGNLTPTCNASILGTGDIVMNGGALNTFHSSGFSGVIDLVGGTFTVSTVQIQALAIPPATAGSTVLTSRVSTSTSCTTCGEIGIGTVIPGTSFVITSSNASDTSRIYWRIETIK
jgi:hypothetical protein